MIALNNECQHENRKKDGKLADGRQRYKCKDCGRRFTANTLLLGGMRIGTDRAVQIISHLVEGTSVRATSRLLETDAGHDS